MKLKEKVLNILLVRRSETNNKWWHRLFTVLLFGSTIIVFLFSIALINDGYSWSSWITYHPVAFSLEPNYQTAVGKELPCEKTFDFLSDKPLTPIIQCNGIALSSLEEDGYIALYDLADKNLEKQFGLDKYNSTNYCSTTPLTGTQLTTTGTQLTKEQIACFRKSIDAEQADPAYAKYQDALKNIAHIKVARDINFGVLLGDILPWLITPVIAVTLWIIFWSSIVYRSVLYIIFGKKIK